MARRHNEGGGNHLDQESSRQKTMEDIDGGLHPAVDEQSLGERQNIRYSCNRVNELLMPWLISIAL